MIQLYGLTARQVEIADELWKCETQEDVLAYIGTLNKKDQYDARSIVISILQNAIEDDHDGSLTQAVEVLENIMKKL